MAKRQKINRSEKIRQYLAEHPDQAPTRVAQALKQYGVTAPLVSNIKNRMKKGRSPTQKKAKKKAAPSAAATADDQFAGVVAAAQLIKTCGGVEHAQQALKTASKVVDLLR